MDTRSDVHSHAIAEQSMELLSGSRNIRLQGSIRSRAGKKLGLPCGRRGDRGGSIPGIRWEDPVYGDSGETAFSAGECGEDAKKKRITLAETLPVMKILNPIPARITVQSQIPDDSKPKRGRRVAAEDYISRI